MRSVGIACAAAAVPDRVACRVVSVQREAVVYSGWSHDAHGVLHLHGHLEVTLVLGGSVEVHWRGGTALLERGDAAIVPPTVVHGLWVQRGPAHLVTLHVSLPTRCGRAEPEAATPSVSRSDTVLWDWLTRLGGVAGAVSRDRAEACIDELLGRLSLGGAPVSAAKMSCAIRTVKDRIDARPSDPMSLRDMARHARLSPWHLLRTFAEGVGLTPRAYAIQRRIMLAHALMIDGRSVESAASASGFVDRSHLARHFKRNLAITPGIFHRAIGDARASVTSWR